MTPLALVLCATVQATPVVAQNAPPPPPPVVYDVGHALTRSITHALTRRGFADENANARIQQTLKAINARLRRFEQADDTWLTTLGRMRPYDVGGFAISGDIRWRTPARGQVYSTMSRGPKKSPALLQDGPYWMAEGVVGSDPTLVALQMSVLDADPKVWRLNAFAESTEDDTKASPPAVHAADSGPDAAVEPSPIPSSPQPQHHRRYARDYRSKDCPDGGCLSSVLHVEYHAQGAPATCESGSYYDMGAAQCAPYHFRKDGDVFVTRDEQTASYATYEQAYDGLPRFVKDSPLSPTAVAELANRVWRDAAVRPGFAGVPFLQAQPVTVEDARFKDADTSVNWPQVSDLAEPLPTKDPLGLKTLDQPREAQKIPATKAL